MNLDLTPEKKALITLGVVVLIVTVYAYNPFFQTSNNTTVNNTTPSNPSVVPVPFTQQGSNNTTSNNTTANPTGQITAEQAQTIAAQANHGYASGLATQGSITINGQQTSVWVVPLSKDGSIKKTVYIDSNTGKIIQQT
jgi:predicted pyridoxine 5'-phosphate oxidase superfamily flavin-nucleotide-binding protein